MSGAVSVEDYAVVLIWLAICSVYTTLLTVTALGVVYLLRKRRSSILKSQRPPRTPFSELEFNVATPTDTAKSRRVSFSRRTGVAEFVTNEATTTWKTFYEEHNKSLESSGNESGANPPRPPVGHIGKRIFDQQFQEVEAVDFASTLDNHSRNINTSMNNVKFTQQLDSPENTGDKLTAPQQNFEMSAFTDHQSKLFGDDLAIPTMGEMSGRIEVNFSTIQAIGEIKDDLDEIQKDLERAQSNVVCPGPFTGRKSLSEYIEVDLNATHVTMRNDDDMSITDTIHSPKVQDVSKNCSTSQVDKKASISKDWVADKENIALNPYVTPKESTNFAINDESDKILVFDGKRLTVSSDKEADMILKTGTEDVKPAAPKENKPARKTIVLNVNDDLPNFVDDPMSTSAGILGSASFKLSVMYDDDDISITQPLVSKVNSMPEKNVTLVNESEIGNISLTQAVSDVIIPAKTEKRKTIVYESDNCDISMTQALPAQIIGTNPENKVPERRRTILYENDTGNISITQAIPANIIMNDKPDLDVDKSRTQVFNNIEADISMTQMVPANLLLPANVDRDDTNKTKPLEAEKRKTIVFENDECDISMTQVLPSKIIASEENKPDTGRRRTILYDNDMGNISVTQAIPSNIILNDKSEILNDKSKTVDNIETDISMTQAVPANLLLTNGGEKRKTIVFENEDCDISVTRALPSKIIIENQNELPQRRRTILYENDTGDISMTQAIPANIIVNVNDKINITTSQDGQSKVIVESSASHISDTEILPPKVLSIIANIADKNKTITSESGLADISVTRAVPTNILLPTDNNEKRKTIVYDDATGNISITQALPANIFMPEKVEACETRKSINAGDISVKQAVLVNVVIVNNATEKRIPTIPAYDVDLQNVTSDKSKEVKEADSASVSNTSGVNDIIPIIADAILPVKENTTSETDVENDLIRIKNDVIENMSIEELSPENVSRDKSKITVTENDRITSSDSLIYIIRDTEGETQTDRIEEQQNNSLKWHSDVPMIEHSPLSIGYKEDVDDGVTADLPKKIEELKSVVNDEKDMSRSRVYEKIISSDNVSMKSPIIDTSKRNFRDANDTDELLEMLSDLTDKTRLSKEPEEPKEALETNEPRRLSVAPNRLSIVLSREDLLNNISMAQAVLQRSIQTDDSIEEDTTTDTPVQVSMPPSKAARVSNEVVKKLQFEEDESTSDASIKSELKGSPLKKTAFGETSYMTTQPKGKVIPGYLKDVSDGIKALMNDLVKPTADNIPFQTENTLMREPSTCSNQIQANLVTSSQIDLDTEPNSATNSAYDMEKISMQSSDRSHSLRSSLKSDSRYDMPLSFRPKRYSGSATSQERVIQFDPNNPLNNILLNPIDYSEVHRYEPQEPTDAMNVDSESDHMLKEKESHEKLPTQIVGSVTVTHAMQPSGDSVPDKSDAQSLLSNLSKDESVSVRVCELKDTKVNTVIAMKANKELLEASSSLTLVDDTLAKSTFDVDLDTVPSSTCNTKSASPVKVIFHNDDPKIVSQKGDSDMTSNEELMDSVKTKGKKRNYSPTKRDKHKSASLDVTPKPTVKMQKKSSTPNTYDVETVSLKSSSPSKYKTADEELPQKLTPEKEVPTAAYESPDRTESRQQKKRSPRKQKSPKDKKLATNVTIQQLLTEYDIRPDIDQDALNKQIIEALSRSDSSTAPNTISLTDVHNVGLKSPEIVSSFTSSKNQNEMREDCSVTTTETRTTSSRSHSMKLDWQPELSVTSSNLVSECESSVNVVAKIDMLPFMGSHECEWEASAADTWCFRLLHGRLRLSVRLAHRHDNATRTRVRADTPVLAVALDHAHRDKKNSVAMLCVGFAAEAMRYYVGRGCSRAGDVAALLRRCAGVARVALRWGRAMHEARLHLAYTLSDDGCLQLKVANIPLRSVWEVTMRLELVVADAREVPWPRACGVRVARVVSDVRVSDAEVAALLHSLPRDWGHAPRAIWKIFRYLKNKTREDDNILGL